MIDEILSRYGLNDCQATLLRHNENMTYRLDAADGAPRYVLRVRKPQAGFTFAVLEDGETDEQLLDSELRLLRAAREAGLPCQTPLANAAGEWVTRLDDGACVTVLTWMAGTTLEEPRAEGEELKHLGETVARWHDFFAHWQGLPGLRRYRYGDKTMARIERELKRAKALSPEQAEEMLKAVQTIRERTGGLNVVYAHADLGASNILRTDRGLVPIDFSLSGFAPLEMDLGGLCATFPEDERYAAILDGYARATGRRVDKRDLDPYLALSVLLFIASQHDRAADWDWFPGAAARWCETIFRPLYRGEAIL